MTYDLNNIRFFYMKKLCLVKRKNLNIFLIFYKYEYLN